MGGSSQCCNCTVIILLNELAGHSKHICYNTAYSVDLYEREGSWIAQKTVSRVCFWIMGVGGLIAILQITTVTGGQRINHLPSDLWTTALLLKPRPSLIRGAHLEHNSHRATPYFLHHTVLCVVGQLVVSDGDCLFVLCNHHCLRCCSTALMDSSKPNHHPL